MIRKLNEAPIAFKIFFLVGIVLFVSGIGIGITIGISNSKNSNYAVPQSSEVPNSQEEEPCACCGGEEESGQTASSATGDILKNAEKAGLSYYKDKYNDSSVSAKVTEYSCHIQIDIYKGEKLVKSLGYKEETGIYEIE